MDAHRQQPRSLVHRRIVVKVGTNLLTGGTAHLDPASMALIAGQIAELLARGGQVLLVTSGAIAAGRQRLAQLGERTDNGQASLELRQALAAVGQSRLMALWEQLFEAHGVVVAQALLTRRDLAHRKGYLNARNTLLELIARGIVPVVNENDVVAIDEIRDAAIGDNDNLSAQVANLVDAELLLLLTDVAGLYTGNPAHDRDAQLIARVERIDATIERAAAGQAGQRVTGGMATKLQAARQATKFGAHVVIADGRAPDIVLRVAAGEEVGTHFLPTADRTESRRRYLLSGLQARGRIVVDDGAAMAIQYQNRSLLPAGVAEVSGNFERGDVVRVETSQGHHLATGRVNYGIADIERIRGQRSDRIAELLGYDHGAEIIHRNNLVVL